MYLLKKLVNLGRSSDENEGKREEDASPHLPEDLNDDSSSRDENSTSQDVSEFSETPSGRVDEAFVKTRKFDSEDEAWMPDANSSVDNANEAPRETLAEETNSQQIPVKRKRDKKGRRKSKDVRHSSKESSTGSISSKSASKSEKEEQQLAPVDGFTQNPGHDESIAPDLPKTARKFDSEDEQWPEETFFKSVASNNENIATGLPKTVKKYDSEDEEWLVETENPAVPKQPSPDKSVSLGSRKFDSDDEDWLKNDDEEVKKSDIDEKSLSRNTSPRSARNSDSVDDGLRAPEKSTGSVSPKSDREKSSSQKVKADVSRETSKSVTSEDEEWLVETAGDEQHLENRAVTKQPSPDKSASLGSRKFDSDDEDWLKNDDEEVKKSDIDEKSLSRDTSPTSARNSDSEDDGLRAPEKSTGSVSPKSNREKSSSLEVKTDMSKRMTSEDEEWSPDSTTSKIDATETSSFCEESGTSVESSHTSHSESPKPDESAATAASPEDELKETHQRNFAKALQDINLHPRRRSVIIPDQRERIVHEEHTRHTSESSTDGETTHDDGIIGFLGKENDRAEARLAARRQARVEARGIRMRELERVQKEQEETSDKVFDLHTPARQASMSPRERPTSTNSYHSSRRSSEDSMEDGLGLRDLRHELKEVEEKFRKAMIANAQLDNEKAAHAYQVELLKDKLEDLEEAHSLLGREHRERCREHEALKRATLKLKEELTICRMQLEERDRLIADYGLVIVGGDINEKGEVTPRELVSNQAAEVLESAGEGSLDVRLKNLAKDKNDLVDEVRHLKLELEDERTKRQNEQSLTNGPLSDDVVQTLNDYRFRLQKAEQETNTLQATVARLESQVIRYKSAAEESEKAEDELKTEKRKLLREHRESLARIEELETSNSHLQRRMDKLKNAKSTLLKEL